MRATIVGVFAALVMGVLAGGVRADVYVDLILPYREPAEAGNYVGFLGYSDVGPGKVMMTVQSYLGDGAGFFQKIGFNVTEGHRGKLKLVDGPVIEEGVVGKITWGQGGTGDLKADFAMMFDLPSAKAGRFNAFDRYFVVFESTVNPAVDVLDAQDFIAVTGGPNGFELVAAAKLGGVDGPSLIGGTAPEGDMRMLAAAVPAEIPEPATLGMLGLGMAAFCMRRRAH